MRHASPRRFRLSVVFGEIFGGAAITCATVAACFAAFLALQALSYAVPTERIETRLRQAFETGDLSLANSRPYDAERGYHQRNDCIIYWMAMSRPDEIGEYLAAGQFYWDETQRSGFCQTLRDRLYGDPTTDYRKGTYLRYLHGYRAVTVFLLDRFDIPGMRFYFKLLCYGLLAIVALAALRRFAAPGPKADEAARTRAWAGLGLAAVFGAFYGLSYFGQSPSHAPADAVLFIYLLIATQIDVMALSRWRLYALMGAYGALIAFFEFLTGAAVVGLAMLIGLMTFQGGGLRSGVYVLRGVLMPAAYVGAIALSFAMNLGVNSWRFGSETIFSFFDQIAVRMGTTVQAESAGGAPAEALVTYQDVYDALLRKLDFLTYGDPIFAQGFFFACGFSFVAFVIVAMINARSGRDLLQIAAVLASVGVVVTWYVLFKNHTVIHAAFMVRILVWAPAGVVLAAISAAAMAFRASARPGNALEPAVQVG